MAHGDFTLEPEEAVYTGAASLCSIWLVTFLAELNQQHLVQGNIGTAYLESLTHEKVGFPAGPEFSPLYGHTMIIVKALNGLCLSGLCFHKKLVDTVKAMDFSQSYADPDVWMHAPTTSDSLVPYDYDVVYIDNLFAAMNYPQHFFGALQTKQWNYKLKEIGEPCYHLGANFFHDADGTLYMGTQTYAKHFLSNYKKLSLPENDHPELNDTPLCQPDDITKYFSPSLVPASG